MAKTSCDINSFTPLSHSNVIGIFWTFSDVVIDNSFILLVCSESKLSLEKSI